MFKETAILHYFCSSPSNRQDVSPGALAAQYTFHTPQAVCHVLVIALNTHNMTKEIYNPSRRISLYVNINFFLWMTPC